MKLRFIIFLAFTLHFIFFSFSAIVFLVTRFSPLWLIPLPTVALIIAVLIMSASDGKIGMWIETGSYGNG